MSDFLSSYDSCPICYDDYMETPKALQCLHSFCQKCLQAYISSNAKRNADGWYVHCPVCRSISLPPNKDSSVGNGAAAFPTNFYITRRRSSLSKRRTVTRDGENGVCDLCPNSNKKMVEWICLSCKKAICRECVYEHEKDEKVKHKLHNLYDTLALPSNDSTTPTCPDHDGKQLLLFCVTCLTSVCEACMIDTHYKCAISFLRKDGDRLLSYLNTRTSDGIIVSDNVWHWTTHTGRCRDDIARKVTEAVADVIFTLEQKKARVLSQLDSLYRSQQDLLNCVRLEVSKNLVGLDEHRAQLNSALNSDNEVCLLSRKESKVSADRIGVPNTGLLNQVLNFQPNISFLRGVKNLMDFDIGTVSLETGRWPDPQPFSSLDEDIHQWLSSNKARVLSRIHLSDNRDDYSSLILAFNKYIICADIDQTWLWKYSLDGVELHKADLNSIIGGLCSWANNQIVVTMPAIRQLYLIDHKDLSTRYIRKTSKSYRAVSAASNLFLVCFEASSSCIDILSPTTGGDMEVLKSVHVSSVHLPDPRGCRYLAISADRNFVIADSVQNRLLCLDSHGNFKFVHEESTTPAVCTDKKFIYSSDTSRNTVSRLTLDGRLDCVLLTAEDGLDHPRCLHINEDGHLVVIQGSTSKNVFIYNICQRNFTSFPSM